MGVTNEASAFGAVSHDVLLRCGGAAARRLHALGSGRDYMSTNSVIDRKNQFLAYDGSVLHRIGRTIMCGLCWIHTFAECPVCLEFKVLELPFACMHGQCCECIYNMMRHGHKTCPVCRKPLNRTVESKTCKEEKFLKIHS